MASARAPSTGSPLAYSAPALCRCSASCAGSSLEPSMDRRRGAAAEVDHGDADDDPDELGVFAAERYFYGDDALWCGHSSSSLSSSAFRTGTLEHDRSVVPTPTAATSSSEASWNSRSALLPRNEPPPAAKLRAAATPVAEAEPVVSGAESERAGAGHRRASSSSSNLRRWLLGVAGCACGGGDGEESMSADEMEASSDVLGDGGKKCNTTVASDLSPRTEMVPEQAFEGEPTALTVRPGSGSWLLQGDEALAGREAFYATEIAGHGHRRATNSGEMSMPVIFHPAGTAASDERWRRTKSLERFRPLSDDRGSALGSATQSSGFTIVAGNPHAPPLAAGRGGSGGSPGGAEDDDAAPSEPGYCAYPPSEASVVWSVVTADGAASGNFSSAASGYYHHYYFSGCGEDAAAKGDRRRRSGIAATTATSLLACMSDKAVDAVGPARPVHRPAAVARLGAAGGSRNGHGGGYQHDVMRRRPLGR